jgi:hypothetical protein
VFSVGRPSELRSVRSSAEKVTFRGISLRDLSFPG